MRILLALCCIIAINQALPMDDWHEFKKKYSKEYANGDEEQQRMSVFYKNRKMIDEHNAKFQKGTTTFTMKMNHLGDLEAQEVKAMLNGFNKRNTPINGSPFIPPKRDAPAFKDWRMEGAVTPVKDQGQCGSCWAFSTTGSLEGHTFLKTGKIVSLSEQNLIDCSAQYGNNGCNGGMMNQAFQYIHNNDGIDTELSYPYKAMEGQCLFSARNVGATDVGFVDIPSEDEEALKSALGLVGPVSVAIDAGQNSFHFYSSGVYNEPDCNSENLDHGVLAVGYGSENGQDYWLVKNSWGTGWGDSGYIKMARNNSNMCGIATQASYPKV